MTDANVAERAFVLAEMASNEQVTMAVLAGRESRFSTSEPLAEPPVTYLDDTEAPVYVLTNGKRGIGLGVKNNTIEPDGQFRTVFLVTGRRTLCLVGQAGGDEVIEVPHDSVKAARYRTGFRKHRLILRTPQSAFHCWIHRRTAASVLDDVTDYIDEQTVDEPEPVDHDAANRVLYRGQPVARNPSIEGGAGNGSATDQPDRTS